jgi:hypothetical protein
MKLKQLPFYAGTRRPFQRQPHINARPATEKMGSGINFLSLKMRQDASRCVEDGVAQVIYWPHLDLLSAPPHRAACAGALCAAGAAAGPCIGRMIGIVGAFAPPADVMRLPCRLVTAEDAGVQWQTAAGWAL